MISRSWHYSLLLCLLVGSLSPMQGAISCTSTEECEESLRKGSRCVEGYCSNPFVQGCLKTLHVDYMQTTRTCNSDDPADSSDCIPNTDFEYPEIRIHNGDWESSIFNAWILQILLMEVLQVPVTVGLTTETTAVSGFYSPQSKLTYSTKATPIDALRGATDCQETNEECAHVLPEVWNGQLNEWVSALNDGYIEPVQGNGQVGKSSWYIPKFTAQDDNTLVSFYGLQGESNRNKLADNFRRPTSWLEYCVEVSPNNCTTADETAQHFPKDAAQEVKYFVPGAYTGHFHLTPENNCTLSPDTCIGHIVGPDCTWSTNVEAQMYWNDVKLKPDGPLQPNGGYEYGSLIEIWRAAAATKSNVILWWWRPEALVEEFHGTDAQFQQVLLPEATDICSRARVTSEARCSEDIMTRRGDELGACDQEAHALQKIFARTLSEHNFDEPIASRSPGYDTVKAVKITDLQINDMLRRWTSQGVDLYGNDAREAVCSWVVENLDALLDFVPAGYPKVLSVNSSYQTAFLYVAMAFAILCSLAVLAISGMAYYWRKTKVFVYAQAHIVFMILFGFLMITVGAFTTALEPTSAICAAQTWLVNLGYTVELVPLLVKIAAINKILSSANKMRRVEISRYGMFVHVGMVILMVMLYLTVWAVVDPSQAVEERVVPDAESNIVETSVTCSSESDIWILIALTWQALLLLMASVLAFQSRDIIQEFNESRKLGTMIYSHFLFLVLRSIVHLLGYRGLLRPNAAAAVTSFLLSLDTLFAMIIYLVPKCIKAKSASSEDVRGLRRTNSSAAVGEIEERAARAQLDYMSQTSQHDSKKNSRASTVMLVSAQSTGSASDGYQRTLGTQKSPGVLRDGRVLRKSDANGASREESAEDESTRQQKEPPNGSFWKPGIHRRERRRATY
jgi:hypothetical protein